MVTSCVGTAFYSTLLKERAGRIKATRGRGRRRKQLLHDFKETRGFCKLREEALDPLFGELALEEGMDLS